MAAPVTTAGTLTCANQGQVSPSSSAKLRISGQPVALFPDVSNLTFALVCLAVDASKNGAPAPCAHPSASSGASSRLTAGGVPVLLDSLTATTTDTETTPVTGPVRVSAGQSKVTST